MFIESSGNIRSQIGQSLNSIRVQVDNRDAMGVADHLTFLVALCSPKLTEEERKKFVVPALEPGKDKTGAKEQKLFRECMTILADLLNVLSEKQLYAYKDLPTGDASDLAALLEQAGVSVVPQE